MADRALIAALLEAGLAAEKEGPKVTTAVKPALCYGKVRVARRGDELAERLLQAARAAAEKVLLAAGCELSTD